MHAARHVGWTPPCALAADLTCMDGAIVPDIVANI